MKKHLLGYYPTTISSGGPTEFTATWQASWGTNSVLLTNQVLSRTSWQPSSYDILRIIIPEHITLYSQNGASGTTINTTQAAADTGTVSGNYDLVIELRGRIIGGGGRGGFTSGSSSGGGGRGGAIGAHGLWCRRDVYIEAYPDQYNQTDNGYPSSLTAKWDYRKCGGFICGGGGGGAPSYGYSTYSTKRSSGRYNYHCHGGGGFGGGTEGYYNSRGYPGQSSLLTNGMSDVNMVGRHYNNVDYAASPYGSYTNITNQYGLPGNAGGMGGVCAGVSNSVNANAYGSSGGYNPSTNMRYHPTSTSTVGYFRAEGITAGGQPFMVAAGVDKNGGWLPNSTSGNESLSCVRLGPSSSGFRAAIAGCGGGAGQAGGEGIYKSNNTSYVYFQTAGAAGKAIITNGYTVTHNQSSLSDFCYGSVSNTHT